MRDEIIFAQPYMKRNLFILLCLAALASVMAGCGFFKDRVKEVKTYRFSDDGASLETAYRRMLDNMVWGKHRIRGDWFVRVTGIVKGTETQLEVYYNYTQRPPNVVIYKLDDEQREAKTFAAFLSTYFVRQAVRASRTDR